MIEVKVAGRRAVCTESALLTSGSVGISVAFEFDGAWEGMSKAAVFIAGDTKIDVLLTEDICLIPWEVLQEPGLDLIVGVYGTNGDTIVMPTVYTNVGRIRHGADFDGSEGTEPTPALVDQIMAAAQNAVDTANSVREDAENGVFDGERGVDGAPGAKGESGVYIGDTPPGEDDNVWIRPGGSINDVATQAWVMEQLENLPAAVTESTVSEWGFTKNTGTYDKPSGGIPKTDLASSVQTSLDKANTALQSHQDISGKEDTSNKVTSISSASTDTQYPTAKAVYTFIQSLDGNGVAY